MSDPPFRYQGFSRPNYTPVPDDVFDILLPELTESELKVLLYVIRRTFGFKKDVDTISLKQMVEGIRTRDGRQLDRGAGVSKTSAVRGVNGLVDKGIIVAVRNRSTEKGDEPTTYQLRFAETPVSRFETPPSPNLEHPRVPDLDPQQTVRQQTERGEFEASKGLSGIKDDEHGVTTPLPFPQTGFRGGVEQVSVPPAIAKYDQARLALLPYVQDLARELNDQAPLTSTTTRLTNMFHESELDLDVFLELVMAARAITQERSGSIRTPLPSEGFGPRPKMAYWFSVLEDLIEQLRVGASSSAD